MVDRSHSAELRRYVRFGTADSERVRASHALVAPHFTRVSDAFYERIREHEEAHSILKDEAQVVRLRASLVRWFEELFKGPHDDAHFERAVRIGVVHVQVGLPPRYMAAAMTLIRDDFAKLLVAEGRADCAASVSLLLDLELAVMLDSYWEHYSTRIRALLEADVALAGQDYAGTLDYAGVIVIGVDTDGRIVVFNREAEATTGYARDEAKGRNFLSMLVPSDLHAELEAHRATALLTGQSPSFDTTFRTRVGRLREVRIRIQKSDGNGPPLFFTASDVTEERALAERTRQAERLASIGTLAAGLAHEIRNPLNGAHLHLTLLERLLNKRDDAGDALEAVRTVSTEVRRLSALVTEFLQFARPQPLVMRQVVLREVVEQAVRVLAPEASKHDVELECDFPTRSVSVRGDGDKLTQVLMNLLRNAIEALTEHPATSGSKVVVRIRRQPRVALLEVEDNGPGLPNPDAPIFDAFYSTKSGGTGLGLPIAHRIVADHGGALTAESTPGRTIFRMLLPVLQTEELSTSPHSEAKTANE